MKKLSLFFVLIILKMVIYAQLSTITSQSLNTNCVGLNDVIVNANIAANNYNRFGLLTSGTWGGYGFSDIYCALGFSNFKNGTDGSVEPNNNTLYGFGATMNSDRLFFGLKNNVTGCKTPSSDNITTGIVAWGNDLGDRLAFEAHNCCPTAGNPSIREVATMLGNGNVGIGTSTPIEQLHTTGGVIFSGLTTGGTITNLVGIDVNGKLWRTTNTNNITNNCININSIPKLTSTNTYGCSQIFDNGNTISINNSTGPFNYTSLSTTGPITTTTTGTSRLWVQGVTSSIAYWAWSDEKFKTNIQPYKNALQKVLMLEGKSYNWKSSIIKETGVDNGTYIGFIAQDLLKVIPEAVIKRTDGYYGVNYDAIIPVLSEAIKEQQKQIEELKSMITIQAAPYINPDVKSAKLYQNAPNPFYSETYVKFYLPETVKKANIIIYDLQGKELRNLELNDRNEATIIIHSNELQPGMYIYTLISDGNIIDTKRMILTRN